MARFDIMEAGFSSLDETVNFGTRAISDNKGLHEIYTLAVIRSSETNSSSDNLKITSYYQQGKIFFSINNMLRIIKDKEISEEMESFEFSHIIDSFCVSHCGKYILTCTQDGKVTIRANCSGDNSENGVSSEFSIVYEENFEHCNPTNGTFFVGTFVDDSVDDNVVFYVVTSQGLVAKIEQDINNTNKSFISEVLCDIKMTTNTCSFGYPYMCIEGTELVILDVCSKLCQYDDAIGLKSLHSMGPYFWAYDQDENLYRIDASELLIFCVNDKYPHLLNNIDEAAFIVEGEKKSKIHLLGITKDTPQEKRKVELISVLDQELIYSIPLEGPAHLMNINNLSEDVMFFTEIHRNNYISEIRLQVIIEADPESRVIKLIQKQRFDEAEKFAKTFDVSPVIIAEAKAQYIINKIICNTNDIDELLSNLDIISDELFKLNCCNIVDCELGSDTRRVLSYGASMNISVKDCEKNKDDLLLKTKRGFISKLCRFDTFMQIYHSYDNLKWKYFVDCDLIDELKSFLLKGHVEEATILFSQMDPQIISYEKIEEISCMINESLLSRTTFLSVFIPISLKYVPESLVIFVNWLHDRVYQLEKENDLEYPECAIKLFEYVIKLINLNVSVRKPLGFEMQNKLTCLLKALKGIEMLFNNYGIKFPLSEFLTDPASIVKTLLYVDMDKANLEALLRNFMCPIIMKSRLNMDHTSVEELMVGNQLNMDDTLVEEIKNLLDYEEEYWTTVVRVLFPYIGSVDKKLMLTSEFLGIANVPWSESVKNIALSVCQLAPSHPIAENITTNLYNEQIWIILGKYNLCRTQFESLDDQIFCFNRIIYLNRETMLDDLFGLCSNDIMKQEAELLVINRFIRREQYNEAMSVIDKNEPEKVILLCEILLERCLEFATCDYTSKKYRDHYYIPLKLVWSRLQKYASKLSKLAFRKMEAVYKSAYAVYGIEKYFDMRIKTGDLIGKRKTELLDTLVRKVTETYMEDENFETFLFHIQKLSCFFEECEDKVLMKCLIKSNDVQPFTILGKYLLSTSNYSKVLACLALYLFKFLKENITENYDETMTDVFSNMSNKASLESIKLAKKLVVKAMMCATSEDRLAVLEVLRWIDSCFYLTNPPKQLNTDILQIYYTSNPLTQETFEAIKSSFNIYCSALGSSCTPNMKYLTYFTTNVSSSLDIFYGEMNQLTGNITTILNDDQHLTTFNIIKTIQQGLLCNTNIPREKCEALQSLIQTQWLPKTLEAVLSFRYIDKSLLLNLMLLCDNYEKLILNYLHAFKRKPNKLSVITQVGLELFKYHKNTDGIEDLYNILNLCKWWNKLTDKRTSYNSFFTAKCEDRFESLILTKQVNLSNLAEYCTDFSLNLQSRYLKYLEILLKNWQPKVEYITEINGSKNIVIKNSVTELASECSEIVNCISNKEKLLTLIEGMWPTINFYYYETFEVLLSIHSKLSSTKNMSFEAYSPLLVFLKGYKRVSKPSRSEVEHWCGTFPLKACIDPLSEFRLPLTGTFFSRDIWDIIKPEVNIQTYKQWFKITPILDQFLNVNDICIYAINGALSTELGENKSNVWELYPKYEPLIADVEECAKNITHLERATAAVYTLMCSMPPGIDKVRMAKLSYKYAVDYRNTDSSDDVEKAYVKVKQRYFNYSTIHILHKYELAEDKYLELVAQPNVLVSKLYEDPRIVKQYSSINFQCPDINRAVEEVCNLFGLSAKKMKFDILLNFLDLNFILDLDSTISANPVEDKYDLSHTYLKRACYICEGNDFHKSLLKIGINSEEDLEYSMSFRANALKCFYYTSDVNTIETMSHMDQEQFVAYMEKVSIIAKLEGLGFKLKTVKHLDEFNKKKLLKELAKIHKPLAIKCIASICKIYGLDDMKYWEFIVNTAIQFRMVTDLREYVEYLKFRCVTDVIIKAWQLILSDAFTPGVNESDILEGYISALMLLQTCPVLYALKIEDYIEKCISNKRLEIAAILLQYLPIEKHESFVKVILSKSSITNDVAGLKNRGIIGINRTIGILGSYR